MSKSLKVIWASLLSLSIVSPSFASAAESEKAPTGFYNVNSLSYKSLNEFKQSTIQQKRNFFTQDWFLVNNGRVIKAIDVLTLSNAELTNSMISEDDFEKNNNVVLAANGEIKKVDNGTSNLSGTIDRAGTYGGTEVIPAVYEGTMTIKSADVNLEHTVIKGDLIIASSVGEGNVHFNNVKVEGKTIINGGGENSVHFTDSTLVTIIVNKNTSSVRVVAHGDTDVDEVKIESPAILLEDNLTGNSNGFTDILLGEPLKNTTGNVELVGSYNTVNSIATNVRIHIPSGSSVNSLALSALATVLGEGVIGQLEASGSASGSSLAIRPQNVVLDIDGGAIEIGGDSVSEGYTSADITTIRSISATPSFITVNLEDPLTNLSADDFVVTATIDGQPVILDGLQYNRTLRIFEYNPIGITEANLGKFLKVKVTPKEGKQVIGSSVESEYEIGTGFSGRITDIYGKGIRGLNLEFTSISDSRTDRVSAVTDLNGYYFVYAAPSAYSGMITGAGYVDTPINAAVASNRFELQQNGTVIRAAASNEVKIMLSWDKYPSDLDSHLTGPGADGTPFHIAYYNKEESTNGMTYVDLDWDDTDSYGPETTTIRKLVDGDYRFYIHNYSGDSSLRLSGAKVEVFKGDSKTPDNTFNVPTGEGNEPYWVVFDLKVSNNGENVELKPVNMMVEEETPRVLVNGEEVYSESENSYVQVGAKVELAANTSGTKIHYTMDGSQPTIDSSIYEGPITITENTTINAIVVKDGMIVGYKYVDLKVAFLEKAIEQVDELEYLVKALNDWDQLYYAEYVYNEAVNMVDTLATEQQKADLVNRLASAKVIIDTARLTLSGE